MTRRTLLWLSAIAMLAVLVAYQVVVTSAGDRDREFAARADVPTVQPGVDVLGGIVLVPIRIHRYDYRRAAFGDAWTDDTDAPGGHNGCDTRDDILNRDLVDKTNRVDQTLPRRRRDRHPARPVHQRHHQLSPWRRNRRGGADRPHRAAGAGLGHGSLRLAGCRNGSASPTTRPICLRCRGQANQDKSDSQPALWMPPNTRVLVPVRHAIHRGVTRVRASHRPGVGQRPASGRSDLPDRIAG